MTSILFVKYNNILKKNSILLKEIADKKVQ